MVDRGAESGGVHIQSMSLLNIVGSFLLSSDPCAPETPCSFEVFFNMTFAFPVESIAVTRMTVG
jgi:hypothetical protein